MIYEFTVKDAEGKDVSLSSFKGKVCLIVNVASKCGFTKQYEELQKLFSKFADKDFVVLGFPCNQFGGQEPGSDAEIQEFCKLNYGVAFPVFAKIEVNGKNTDPLYKYLKTTNPGLLGTEDIKWNFTKFLVDRNGTPVKRFAPQTSPTDIESDITKLL
jgi:glutathione peroxidase